MCWLYHTVGDTLDPKLGNCVIFLLGLLFCWFSLLTTATYLSCQPDSPGSKLCWFFRGSPLRPSKDRTCRFSQQARHLLESWFWELACCREPWHLRLDFQIQTTFLRLIRRWPSPILPHGGCPGPWVQLGRLLCGTHVISILFPGNISLVFRPILGPISFQAHFPDITPIILWGFAWFYGFLCK